MATKSAIAAAFNAERSHRKAANDAANRKTKAFRKLDDAFLALHNASPTSWPAIFRRFIAQAVVTGKQLNIGAEAVRFERLPGAESQATAALLRLALGPAGTDKAIESLFAEIGSGEDSSRVRLCINGACQRILNDRPIEDVPVKATGQQSTKRATSPTTDPLTGKFTKHADGAKRSCYDRDRVFLELKDGGMGDAAIRDKWNNEHPRDGIGGGEAGREVVKKGIQKSRKERAAEK